MSPALTLLSFQGRRAPLVQKVVDDGKRMYEHARYVIILDKKGSVIEHFENPPFNTIVDCLVVLGPVVYKGVSIALSVILEIGFRRFAPYKQTEYRVYGKPKRTSRKKGVVKNRIPVPRAKRGVIKAIPSRTPIATMTDTTRQHILGDIASGIQTCVDSIIETWGNSDPVQERENKCGEKYTYVASVFVRIPKQERLLCAAARFKETEFRLSNSGPLGTLAKKIRALCRQFIANNTRSKTEQGDYLQSSIKKSHIIWRIKETLDKRIKYRKFTEQMISRMLTLVGKRDSAERKLLDQVFKIRGITKPVKDVELETLEREFGHIRKALLAKWPLTTFISMRHANRRTLHASGCLTVSVLGSRSELEKMIAARDIRRVASYTQEDTDEEIPF